MDRSASLVGTILVVATSVIVVLSGLPQYAFVLSGIGPLLAGALAEPEKYDGAVEGSVSCGVAVPIVLVIVVLFRFLQFQGLGPGTSLELVWFTTGPQAIGSIFIVLPLVLVIGAGFGWVGQLVRDIANGGVSIK